MATNDKDEVQVKFNLRKKVPIEEWPERLRRKKAEMDAADGDGGRPATGDELGGGDESDGNGDPPELVVGLLTLYKLLNQRRDNFKHYYRFRAVPSHCRPRASRVIKAARVTANRRPKVPKVLAV